MKVSYYPGCTLKSKAKNLDDAAVAAMAALGVSLEELPRWNCWSNSKPSICFWYLVGEGDC